MKYKADHSKKDLQRVDELLLSPPPRSTSRVAKET